MLPMPAIPACWSRNDFSGALRPCRQLAEHLGGELLGERLHADPSVEAGGNRRGLDQLSMTEAAGVGEQQGVTLVEVEDRAQVGGLRLVGLDPQASGHPQVDDQSQPSLEPEQQVLAAAIRGFDPPPLGALQGRRRLRSREALVEHFDRGDRPPQQLGLELTADRLHLGQLWHLRNGVAGAAGVAGASGAAAAAAPPLTTRPASTLLNTSLSARAKSAGSAKASTTYSVGPL